LAWKIEYADSVKDQLRKLDKQVARRILDFMDERIANLEDPRSIGEALKGARLGPCAFWLFVSATAGKFTARLVHRAASSTKHRQ
jgi:mRNA interferase RelE/StbE